MERVVRAPWVIVLGAAALVGCQDSGAPAESTSEAGGSTGISESSETAATMGGTSGDSGSSESGEDTDSSETTDGETTGGIASGTIVTELSGHAVDSVPLFRRVDNFNDGELVEVAFDPGLHGLAAAECDLYVTAAKDEATWSSDPSLVDVRAAGPQTIVLGTTLADTRFEVSGALSSDAGMGLGVPYDLVLDCDLDGTLGDGDVIDGGTAPGLFRTHDATAPGPMAVSSLEHSGGSFLGQRVFYPTNISELDAVPLVVVTHGWSYTYAFYDYIGEHLASYGYVVMHHEANVQDGGPPGTMTAGANTLENTDYLLANLANIEGGVLDGHIDARRIMFTGHSTGGEAVVRAVTQLREGSFTSEHFGYEDIAIVSSMAPVSWHPRTIVDPGDVNYHQFIAGADDDVSGAPLNSYTQSRSIYERSTGTRQLTTIHGAGHGDLLDCCGELFLDTSAPNLIGREATKVVARGYFLAMAELYLQGNTAGREFFSRPFADYHPSGIGSEVVVTNEYREVGTHVVVLDDFESSGGATEPLSQSSAGTAVSLASSNTAEVLMRDNDGSFAWTGDQPSNGMTHARHEGDAPHALVFDFAPGEAAHYEVALPADIGSLEEGDQVSLRLCQGTRHPETIALSSPMAFTVTVIDADGRRAEVLLDGARSVPQPYARGGNGAGVGWGNEFSSVRVPLVDFLGAEPALDLDQLTAVRIDFGEGFGSPRGRVGLDDVELVRNN